MKLKIEISQEDAGVILAVMQQGVKAVIGTADADSIVDIYVNTREMFKRAVQDAQTVVDLPEEGIKPRRRRKMKEAPLDA